MKELWLFTLSGSVEETVVDLGKLGVVDIQEIHPPAGETIEWHAEKAARAGQAMAILEERARLNGGVPGGSQQGKADPAWMIDRILMAVTARTQGLDMLGHLHRQLKWYETWGKQIALSDFQFLREKGIYIRLYLLGKKEWAALPKGLCIVTFPEQEGRIPVALVARTADEKLPAEEVELPVMPLAEVRRQIVRKERQLREVDLFLDAQLEHMVLLRDYLGYLHDRLNTQRTLAGMGDIEGSIKYLKGFIPKPALERFRSEASQKHWGYRISEPEHPEEVPVYIKNPKWISMINPVMKFIDIVPGYKEVDVSVYFLLAFALFFAMLVGDAGYGALFLLLALLFRKKLSAQMRLLIYVLSGATIVWGVLSGTYFGSERIAAVPFFQKLIIPEIASFGVDNIAFMMHLTFLIGAIHLTMAHSIRAFRVLNSVRMLSEVGWIALMWGIFLVAEQLVLGKAMPDWAGWLFGGGAALVILFSGEGKTFIGSVLASIANLPLSLINGFSDIVSYVRLFAVGMATAAVASSFNNMILPAGVDRSLLDLLMATVALTLGHGLNIILALMAVMVHGIRLNMLEFAGHLGVQFSGKAYQPFRLHSNREEWDGYHKTQTSPPHNI